GPKVACMSQEPGSLLTGRQVPELHLRQDSWFAVLRLIRIAATGENLAIKGERQGRMSAAAACLQARPPLAAGYVPQLHRSVTTCGRQDLTVWAKCNSVDRTLILVLECAALVGGRHVPQPHDAFLRTACGQRLTIGTQGNGHEYLVQVLKQNSPFPASQVPER